MGMHDQLGPIHREPATTIAGTHIHEIDGAVELRTPLAVFDAVHGSVHEDDAAGAEERLHAAVGEANKAVTVLALAVGQCALEVSPALHHPGEEFRAPRIEGGIKTQGNAQGGRRGAQMGEGRREGGGVAEEFVEGDIVPAGDLQGVEMVDSRQGIEFVQAGNDTVILDVRQAADANDQFGPSMACGQLEAGAFDIAIRQAKTLTSLPKTETGVHLSPPSRFARVDGRILHKYCFVKETEQKLLILRGVFPKRFCEGYWQAGKDPGGWVVAGILQD